MWSVTPIACTADAQALATVKPGPVMPVAMLIWLDPALAIRRGMVKGCTRCDALGVSNL